MGVLCNVLMGDGTYPLGNTIIPLVLSDGSPPRSNDSTRPPSVTDRRRNEKDYLVV